ncbi:MAG: methylmalonyl-CoA mutase family protein [Candidatus Aenigmarchaeota archaeon]|nr:methylmalonyl-CoA mutase family protein [Candidatus Aenigmarchaeota archaeon]
MTAKKTALQEERLKTLSGFDVKRIYTGEDSETNYDKDLGEPGKFPFTRGVYETMYREKLWTMRLFSGFGTPEQTNRRLKYLIAHGQTGLSIAFHMPTLVGYNSDHPLSAGEVGKVGVAVDSLKDMEILFDGIKLDEVTTSMTINGPACAVWAFYIAAAENQGANRKELRGTIQNDVLKEYTAQKTWIFPPEPGLRLVVDTIEFASKELPKWHPVSISGYHIREAGSTATQELAFTLADGLCYVDSCIERGLSINDFCPRLSFFFNSHNDFFEEIAKYRAARRIWAKEMKKRNGNEQSQKLRFHTQTAGCTLTAQQPLNNIVRVTMQALAAVLGGTQSLHTNSYDEALALPTDESAKLALRTQQIIAYESGVTKTVDPLGGSYYIEWLTNRMEEEAYGGGVLKCIEKNFFQSEIAKSAYEYQKAVDENREKIVGVNCFQTDERQIKILKISSKVRKVQSKKLSLLRKHRDNDAVRNALDALVESAKTGENIMPPTICAVESYCTVGEICSSLAKVFGEHKSNVF